MRESCTALWTVQCKALVNPSFSVTLSASPYADPREIVGLSSQKCTVSATLLEWLAKTSSISHTPLPIQPANEKELKDILPTTCLMKAEKKRPSL